VKLPGGRQIIVDAKVPLEAYLKAMEAADEEARQAWLEDHARQVRSHIDGLSRKAYWDQFQPTPEFVFMFLPGEALLAAALQQDSTLLDYAVTKRVIPATPLTLIALLRAVAYGWQQEKIAENAEEISRIGRELYERINVVARHFAAVGRNLREAMDSFNKAVGSIESRLLVSARRLKDLGAGTGDDVPEIEPVDVVPRELQVNGESRLKTED
jgi:DNA recombination protein RmuC